VSRQARRYNRVSHQPIWECRVRSPWASHATQIFRACGGRFKLTLEPGPNRNRAA